MRNKYRFNFGKYKETDIDSQRVVNLGYSSKGIVNAVINTDKAGYILSVIIDETELKDD